MMPVLCAIFLGLVQSPDLEPFLGSYRADFSRARKHRSLFEGYFGKRALVLARDGTFEICGLNQSGYWRKEGHRLVLVYRGFFGRPFSETNSTLKRTVPRSNFEGLILRVMPDKTLRLDSFGVAKGPIFFKRKGEEPLSSLITKNGNLDHPDWPETFMILKNRATIEQRAIVDIALDPKAAIIDRTGAAFAIGQIESVNPKTFQRLLNALPALPRPSGKFEKRFFARLLQRRIVEAILKRPTLDARRVLISLVDSGAISAQQIEPLFESWTRPEDTEVLTSWLSSNKPDQVVLALKVLAKSKSTVDLERASQLTSDDSKRVQYYTHATIARLSSDKDQRMKSFIYLLTQTKEDNSKYSWDACLALCTVQTAESLPYLAAALLAGDTDEIGRSDIAKALGELADARAVPSLLEALKDDSLPAFPMFRVKVLESLDKIAKAKKESQNLSRGKVGLLRTRAVMAATNIQNRSDQKS